jgi:hypothetical protein
MYVVFQAALDAMRRRANEWGALAPGPPSPSIDRLEKLREMQSLSSRELGSKPRDGEVGESVSRSLHGSVDRNLLHAEPVRASHGSLYREPLLLALNFSFQRRNSSTRASRTLGADVATFGGRPLRSGIVEGGRGVTNSRPSRTLSADVGTFDGRALRLGIAAGGRGVKPDSPCPCASRWAAYARSREPAEKAEPPVARAAMTASPISKRFIMPSRCLPAAMYAPAADICSAGRPLTVKVDGFKRYSEWRITACSRWRGRRPSPLPAGPALRESPQLRIAGRTPRSHPEKLRAGVNHPIR